MMELYQWWPLILVLIPLIAAFLTWLSEKYFPVLSNTIVISGCLFTLPVAIIMWRPILNGVEISLNLGGMLSTWGLTFRVDLLSYLLVLVSALAWLAAAIYSLDYMKGYENQGRYYIFFLITFSGTLGVPLAGDFLTLLMFFEVMSLASYALVVHTQSSEAYGAGNMYLYMGIFGGLSIFTGIAVFYYFTGSIALLPDGGAFAVQSLFSKYIVAILLITGFGIKAGMAPLHIWLPRAHPVAPAPASALLSGIMIKTGAYGIIKVLLVIMFPQYQQGDISNVIQLALEHISGMGYVMIWAGIITMFFGVCMALIQENAKKMLACHSISQMGYILMGIGAAGYMTFDGSMGLSGAVYHIINHALFKSLLFLVVGMVYLKTKELDMYKLGGLWRNFPFTAAAGLVAALGIAGFPGLNGYASKTLLHHAIYDAAGMHNLTSLWVAEKIFMITGAGTVCSFIKLYSMIFLGKRPEKYKEIKGESWAVKISMSMFVLAIVALGIFPNLFVDNVLVPMTHAFSMDALYTEGHLVGMNLFTYKDLSGIVQVFALGALIFYVGKKTGVFHSKVPLWLGEEYLGTQFQRVFTFTWKAFEGLVQKVIYLFKKGFVFLYHSIFNVLTRMDFKPDKEGNFSRVNFANLDFDIFLVIIMLGVIMTLVYYLQGGA